MKKLNIMLITLLLSTSVFAVEVTAEASQYIRAAFWIFTLVISIGGLLVIVKRRDSGENFADSKS